MRGIECGTNGNAGDRRESRDNRWSECGGNLGGGSRRGADLRPPRVFKAFDVEAVESVHGIVQRFAVAQRAKEIEHFVAPVFFNSIVNFTVLFCAIVAVKFEN